MSSKSVDTAIPPCEKNKVILRELTNQCLGCYPITIIEKFHGNKKFSTAYLGASYSEDRKQVNCCVFRETEGRSKLKLVIRFSLLRPAIKQLATLTET